MIWAALGGGCAKPSGIRILRGVRIPTGPPSLMKTAANLKSWVGTIPERIGSSHFRQLVAQWFDEFGDICQSCEVKMTRRSRHRRAPNFATIDHIQARGLGGTNAVGNLQVICNKCNGVKSVGESHAANGQDRLRQLRTLARHGQSAHSA